MTNIEKWPEAFENGIPKVGGRWRHVGDGVVWTIKTHEANVNATSDKGRAGLCLSGFFENATFLGFADSVNQGAAAPQKLEARPASLCWHPVGGVSCNLLMFHAGPHANSAPVVAPPPSLKAAVQQEGLSIPPQTGTRHEEWERLARGVEGTLAARGYASAAQASLAADLAYDAEASAIREGRTVLKAALKEMGQGDRRCFDLRGLREFEAIKSDAHTQWLWWSTVEAPAAPKGNSP